MTRKFGLVTGALSTLLVVYSLLGTPTSMAQIASDWNGGTGDWSNSANWSTGSVPSNSGSNFYNVFIDNGNAANSVVNLDVNAIVDSLTIDSSDTLNFVGGSDLNIVASGARTDSGKINNDGNINLDGSGSTSAINFTNGGEINGSGTITMSGANAQITGSNAQIATFGANQTIQGEGRLGNGSLHMVNNGTIDANVSGKQLIIDPRNAGASIVSFENNGTVKATNGGEVVLNGTGLGDFGGSGVYLAENGSQMSLRTNANIRNTTFETSGSGVVRALDGQTVSLFDVTNNGNLVVGNNTDLRVSGAMVNTGNIKLESMGLQSDILLQADTTLTGGGTVEMTGVDAQINSLGNFLLTNVDNTIKGRGNLGDGTARITNQATIESDSGILNIDPRNNGAGVVTFDNQGTVVAKSGGEVVLNGAGFGDFGGTGVYRAENGSQMSLRTNANIRNTTFDTSGSGVVRALDGQTVSLFDVTNNGNLVVGNNTDLRVSGAIVNNGNIKLESMGSQSDILLQADTTLTGGGTVEMTGIDAQVNSLGNFLLTNVDNTIKGRGNLGDGTARITNQATIESDSGVLNIDPRNNGAGVVTFDNQGTVVAKSGGEVVLNGAGFGDFGGSGVYRAESGSQMSLSALANIRNTTFDTSGSGVVRALDGQTVSLFDVTNNGNLVVGNNTDLRVSGAIVNNGNIKLESMGSQSDILLQADTTLTGGGTVEMTGIDAQVNSLGNFRLTNVDNTIRGAGNLGDGSATITNESLIKADVAGSALLIDPRNTGSAGAFVNTASGELRASMGGQIIATGVGFGGFDIDGKVVAFDGSSITFNSTAVVESVVGGVLQKGDWKAMETGSGATLKIDHIPSHFTKIGANASITLSGANAKFEHGSSHAQLDQNDGVLKVANGNVFQTGVATFETFANNGLVTIDDARIVNTAATATYVQNSGVTELQNGGQLSVRDVAINDGSLVGNGSIGDMVNKSDSIILDNNSLIAPGNSAGVIDMYVDPVGQAELRGTFEVELGGLLVDGLAQDISLVNRSTDFTLAEYDQINVFGDALIDGATLDVSEIAGFSANVGDFFDVFSADNLTLSSFSVSGPAGYVFDTQVLRLNDVAFGGDRDVLRLTVASVPEPSTMLVFTGLSLGLLMRRRK